METEIFTLYIIDAFILFGIVTLLYVFSRYQRTLKELQEANKKLKGSKEILEEKVRERTKELETLSKEQEKIIAERTKETQEKLVELEKFQKLAVGRELKMVDLKKEVNRLGGEVANLRNDVTKLQAELVRYKA